MPALVKSSCTEALLVVLKCLSAQTKSIQLKKTGGKRLALLNLAWLVQHVRA